MMVPRSFMFSSVPQPKPLERKVKQRPFVSKTPVDMVSLEDDSALHIAPESSPQTIYANPVVIPPKSGHRMASAQSQTTRKDPRTPKRNRVARQSSSSTLGERPVPTSIASILEATAIPVPRRKRPGRSSQRLPPGNHVQDFSRLLMDGLDDQASGSGNSTLDILLSPPEENEKTFVLSDCDSDSLSYSAPSISADSVPSLDADMDTPSSFSIPFTPSCQRSLSDKAWRRRRPSKCENCVQDHPLLDTDESDSTDEHTITSRPSSPLDSTPSKPLVTSRTFPRLGSFKSNLTASLRAIKSAAQSVSAFASPSVQPDDFLTRSLFTITPEMTDDRRPPPMNETPSPALRRYLNPISPAEMYSFQDQPHESLDSRDCPAPVQMQTYHRLGSRGSRNNRFQISSSENRRRQSSPFDPETPPISRQREPRENSDFLRKIVLEMNMRRGGKLRDDIPPRARVWLPPRKTRQAKFVPYDYIYEEEDELETAIPSRWIGISIESF
ncbi:hypothetical protein BDV18DRAFT_147188 [Aspergillus unguis]